VKANGSFLRPPRPGFFRYRKLRYQSPGLIKSQFEHEIRREPGPIPSDGLVQPAGGHPIERCEIRVEYHALAADDVDPRLDPRGDRLRWHSDDIGAPLLG